MMWEILGTINGAHVAIIAITVLTLCLARADR